MNEVINISGLEKIYNNYDTFILDQWGVMHDGNMGYLKAIQCVEKLYLEKKNLIIISNSSKRKNSTLLRLPALGFNQNHFIDVMTSGEMIWKSLFNQNYSEIKNLGKYCFHIFDKTKVGGKDLLNGLEFNSEKNIKESDFILGCTPFANTEVLDYVPILNIALERAIPFICANPDFQTIETSTNGDNLFCMGTISELYKNMGGRVFFLGKPNIDIYVKSTQKINNLDKSRVLAVGDSLHHDIKGAINYGIDSLLITSTGIHSKIFDKKKVNWDHHNSNTLLNMNIRPNFICSEFTF